MLHIATSVLTGNFLQSTTKGLLIIYDKSNQTTCLSWIKSAELEGLKITFQLDQAIIRRHGELEWNTSTTHTFTCDIQNYVALDELGNGYHCFNADMEGPTFRVYPAEYFDGMMRSRPILIALGRMIR